MFLVTEEWAVSVMLSVAAATIYTFLHLALYHKFFNKWARSKHIWDDVLARAFHIPLLTYIWLLTTYVVFEDVVKHFKYLKPYVGIKRVIYLLMALVIFWFFVRLTKLFEKRLITVSQLAAYRARPMSINATTVNAISHVIRIFIVIIFILFILSTLGIPLQGLLAFGGVSGIVAAFGARDLLSNFFAGIMIFWDKPFLVGDWIYSPDKEIEGTVEYIGWRLTIVKTFDKRYRYIPNNLFASIVLENASRMTHRRAQETIGIRYEDAAHLKKIIGAMKQYLDKHEQIDQDQPNMVFFKKFSDSTLDIHINFYMTELKWRPSLLLKQDILIDLLAIIHRYKAQCAFPTRTVYLNKED